jgi:hypothetical protein
MRWSAELRARSSSLSLVRNISAAIIPFRTKITNRALNSFWPEIQRFLPQAIFCLPFLPTKRVWNSLPVLSVESAR